LNSENFLEFFEELIDEMPLATRRGLIPQLDGAPPRYAVVVRDWLNTTFPRLWIGQRGPIEWPPRSPDLPPLDFYVWGYMKDKVYAVQINTKEQLIERILSADDDLRQNLQQFDMVEAIANRLRECLQQNGGHIENFR